MLEFLLTGIIYMCAALAFLLLIALWVFLIFVTVDEIVGIFKDAKDTPTDEYDAHKYWMDNYR